MQSVESCKPDTSPSAEKKDNRFNKAVKIFLVVDRLVRFVRWAEKHKEQIIDWLTNL